MQYLCYFIPFCMFGNYWGCIRRSLESAGKVPIKTPVVSWITNTGSKGYLLFRFGMGREGGQETSSAGGLCLRSRSTY